MMQDFNVNKTERKRRCRNTFLAAIGNLSTAYNLVNVSVTHVAMEQQYCGDGKECELGVTISSATALVGAIAGQLTMGYVGDCIGRSSAMRLTMLLTILGAFLSAFVVPTSADRPETVFYLLAATRFILGIGVGGVYPLAATVAAENSDSTSRGKTVAVVFSMQGIGNLLGPLMLLLFTNIFNPNEPRPNFDDPTAVGWAWRLTLGIGCIPGIFLMIFKVRDAKKNEVKGEKVTKKNLWKNVTCKHVRQLIGTAGCWFFFDVVFYGNSIFQHTILKNVFDSNSSQFNGPSLSTNIMYQIALTATLALPGYYLALCLMDKMGRKIMQIQGFAMMAIIFILMGVFFEELTDAVNQGGAKGQGYAALFMIIYGLTFFFANFGPNSTTFILPSETFPLSVRSTLNGVSAAAGKVGASIGAFVFKPLSSCPSPTTNGNSTMDMLYDSGFSAGHCNPDNKTKNLLILCGSLSAIGLLLTIFFVEDLRGKELKDGDDSNDTLEDSLLKHDNLA